MAEGLNMPVGVAFRDGSLYVSAVDRILRLDGIEARLASPPKPQVVSAALPKETHHGWKFIAFGPDGKLYVPVGAPCNICEPDPDRYANIMRMNADGIAARSIRPRRAQFGGLRLAPADAANCGSPTTAATGWADDAPPCELNHAPRAGMHFGYPYCHGGTLSDPEFGRKHALQRIHRRRRAISAPHVAPLGMRFYTGAMFPAAVPQPDLHRRARLVEPVAQDRLPRDAGAARGQTRR
ncbi:MAG: hypothetical protein MZV49_05995 [Rhodopseudomonas palustris]|nr:hypothetical protein [Rhodopseudomonas palustris]